MCQFLYERKVAYIYEEEKIESPLNWRAWCHYFGQISFQTSFLFSRFVLHRLKNSLRTNLCCYNINENKTFLIIWLCFCFVWHRTPDQFIKTCRKKHLQCIWSSNSTKCVVLYWHLLVTIGITPQILPCSTDLNTE